MKNSTKLFLGAISLAGVAAAAAPAFAQDAPPWALTGYVAATTPARLNAPKDNLVELFISSPLVARRKAWMPHAPGCR